MRTVKGDILFPKSCPCPFLKHTCGLGSEPTLLSPLVTLTRIDREEGEAEMEIWEWTLEGGST